jgi:spore maturation protein CgeB
VLPLRAGGADDGAREMKILFVHSAAEWATFDVAMGYREALARLGHEIVYDYRLYQRFKYHGAALGEDLSQNAALLARVSSETIVCEALRHKPDLVLIISGLSVHPDALLMLKDCRIPAAVIFTESPYHDEDQRYFSDVYPEMQCFTNDSLSADAFGWTHLPPAFNPAVHRPVAAEPDDVCDVLIVGTGWEERQRMLEAIDWTGIDLRIRGLWTGITHGSPLAPYYREGCIDNALVPAMYASARICLNQHRAHPKARSVNPRAVEIPACGGFQISDRRPELTGLFGEAVPTFRSADELEGLIRYYLAHDDERLRLAAAAHELVQSETFDQRAQVLMQVVQQKGIAALTAV